MPGHRRSLTDRPVARWNDDHSSDYLARPSARSTSLDVLSEILRAVRLTGAVYFDINAREPWVAESPAMSSICANVMPEFEHVISFHIMIDGWCWVQLDDMSGPSIRLQAGDAVIIPMR